MLRMFNWLHLNSSDVRQICKFSFGELRAMAGEEVIAVELWFLKLDHMWCEVVISLSNQLCGRSYNYRKLQREDSRIHPPPLVQLRFECSQLTISEKCMHSEFLMYVPILDLVSQFSFKCSKIRSIRTCAHLAPNATSQ